eukprot:2625690-Rhodomonas_salina.1
MPECDGISHGSTAHRREQHTTYCETEHPICGYAISRYRASDTMVGMSVQKAETLIVGMADRIRLKMTEYGLR